MSGLWCGMGQIDSVEKPPVVKMHIHPLQSGIPAITTGAPQGLPMWQHHLPTLLIPPVAHFTTTYKFKLGVLGMVDDLARNSPKTAGEIFYFQGRSPLMIVLRTHASDTLSLITTNPAVKTFPVGHSINDAGLNQTQVMKRD